MTIKRLSKKQQQDNIDIFNNMLYTNPKLVYRYYKNLMKMIKERGYEIEIKKYKEFKRENPLGELDLILKNEKKSLYISLHNMFSDKKLGIRSFDEILANAELNLDSNYDIIIIVSEGISPDTKKKMLSVDNYINIQIFTTNELLISRNHMFQPKIKILNKKELIQVCRSYNLIQSVEYNNLIRKSIIPEKLPIIKSTDYLSKYYNLKQPTDDKLGDCIFIKRKDGTVYYRYASKRIGS